MPYQIVKRGDKWAVTTPSGTTVGTHAKKNDAIQQMVAVSIKEGVEPAGEK